MNKLMRQTQDPEQIKGRESRIRIHREKRIIAYQAPNRLVFKIHTRPTESGGEVKVMNKEAQSLPVGGEAHHYGRGHVCLAHKSMRGWDLFRILFQCDSWAKGYETYKETGYFPSSPKTAFLRKEPEQSPRPYMVAPPSPQLKSLFSRLF